MPDIGNIPPLDPGEYERPPTPTVETPFAQIQWIFDKRKERMANRSNPSTAITHWIHQRYDMLST